MNSAIAIVDFRGAVYFLGENAPVGTPNIYLSEALALEVALKRRKHGESHVPLWLLIGCMIFLLCEKKTSFSILTGRVTVFACEKDRSLLSLIG